MKNITLTIDETSKLLKECPMFSLLSDPEAKKLAKVALVRSYSKNELLFRQQTSADGFYIISSGTVVVYRTAPDGREQVLHVFDGGELCGEVPVFQGGSFPASAKADSKVTAMFIPGGDFFKIGEENPAILIEMLAMLSMRLRKFVDLIDDLSLKEVSARLAKYLLDLQARARSGQFELDCSKVVLASKLGTIAETLSRTLGKIQKAGIISVTGKTINICDPDRLHLLAAGEKL